jgi:DNA-binding response OmpR family regulator
MTATVLIVDDSLTVRMDLGEAFEEANFNVLLSETAAAARTQLSEQQIDLVVLDVLLPDADGVEFLVELKAQPKTADIPVILLSTRVEIRDRIRGLKTGADEYVGKPYDRFYVVARATELLRKGAAAGPALVTVLVIDDSLTYREALKRGLEEAGYHVLTAASGEEGLRSAAHARPNAIIVDGFMPGIDGATVVRQIRQDSALRKTPCILLTASEDRGDELKALDAGADAYVRKDDDSDVILARLAAILRIAGSPLSFDATSSLLGPKKILAVDDSLTYLNALSDQLRQEGYEVVAARSGNEALELLAVQSVDCILLDLVMPGMSGHDTCRRIKGSAQWRDIPLLILTAREERESMIEGINAGADDYIAKSNDPAVLNARLRAQLRRKQFEDENRSIREELLKKEIEATEARAARTLAEARVALLAQIEEKNHELEEANGELEAFSYSVSHDLRAPLRAIDAFGRLLVENHSGQLDDSGRGYLGRICGAATRMSELIDDLLELSRVSRSALRRERLNLSQMAQVVADTLRTRPSTAARQVNFQIEPGIETFADRRLVNVVLENLLGNAWKFTEKKPEAQISVGYKAANGERTFYIRDNGAGFDMSYADRLFQPFSRLHTTSEFEGTGIGLATVRRVISRHGGRVWAESVVNEGTTVYFTLPPSASLRPGALGSGALDSDALGSDALGSGALGSDSKGPDVSGEFNAPLAQPNPAREATTNHPQRTR